MAATTKPNEFEIQARIDKTKLLRQYACAALSGLERDVIHMPEAEVARQIWNIAEAMAKEGASRGY